MSFSAGFINGVSANISMVAEPPDYKLQFTSTGVFTHDGKTYSRVVADDKGLVYFGYDVMTETVAGTDRIRVTIGPLSLTANSLNSLFSNSNDHTDYGGLRFLVLPKYPPPQIIESGDTIALDLLVSADGKQKAVDYITFTLKK